MSYGAFLADDQAQPVGHHITTVMVIQAPHPLPTTRN